MSEREYTLSELQEAVEAFHSCRSSMDAYNSQHLTMETALVLEAAEVLEKAKLEQEVADELADILIFLFVIAGNRGIDLAVELLHKLDVNELRFPVEDFQGGADDFIRQYRQAKIDNGEISGV